MRSRIGVNSGSPNVTEMTLGWGLGTELSQVGGFWCPFSTEKNSMTDTPRPFVGRSAGAVDRVRVARTKLRESAGNGYGCPNLSVMSRVGPLGPR